MPFILPPAPMVPVVDREIELTEAPAHDGNYTTATAVGASGVRYSASVFIFHFTSYNVAEDIRNDLKTAVRKMLEIPTPRPVPTAEPLQPPATDRGREMLKAADKIAERSILEYLSAFALPERFSQGFLRECIREAVIKHLEKRET